MGFLDDLAELVEDPAIRRLAWRRAQSRELAEDALQETFRVVAQTRRPEAIEDLRAFFCKSLIRTISRQLSLSAPVLTEDIGTLADSRQDLSPPGTSAPASVMSDAHLRILTEIALTQLERDRAKLMAMIPARSGDPRRYRSTILAAAEKILRLLFEGPVTVADWNAVLGAEYPQWCDEPGLAHDALYQRLGRARADIQALLQAILPRQAILLPQGDGPHHSPGGRPTQTQQAPLHETHQQDERVRTADDAILTALFMEAEQVMLPDEMPYNVEHELQVFTRWLNRQPHRRPIS